MRSRADSWADSVYSSVHCFTPPIDLHAVARSRRVNRIGLRLMVHRGSLVPARGGFEIYLRDLEPQDFDVDAPEPTYALTPLQRFTLAHEVAHTFFYKITPGPNVVPVPLDDAGKHNELEEICDSSAARLLVPTQLLRAEIEQNLGDCERIDLNFVRMMVAKFRVSYDVIIERLRGVEPSNLFARCILLVRKNEGEAQVRTWYMGSGLLGSLPPLKKYTPVVKWFSGFPQTIVNHDVDEEREVTVAGRNLLIQKIPLGHASNFLLQIDDLGRRAPSSGCSR